MKGELKINFFNIVYTVYILRISVLDHLLFYRMEKDAFKKLLPERRFALIGKYLLSGGAIFVSSYSLSYLRW